MMDSTGSPSKTRAGENYLTEAEEKKLFRLLRDRKDRQASRDFVLLKLMRFTAFRRAEITALNVADVWGKDRITLTDRIAVKGGIGEIYIPVEIQELLRRFMKQKKEWGEGLADDDPLFMSKKRNRLELSTVNRLVTKWCKESGIPEYTPHAFRHTKAQRIMADVRHLGEDEQKKALLFANHQLRHKSMNSTMVYTMPTKEQMEKVARI